MDRFPTELTHGTGASMRLDRTRLLVALARATALAEVAPRLRAVSLVVEAGEDGARINHTPTRFWVRDAMGARIEDERGPTLASVLGDGLAWIGPVYQLTTATGQPARFCPLPGVVLVRLADGVSSNGNRRATAAALARRFGIAENRDKSALLAPLHYYELESPSERNAYDLLLDLRRDERVADVRFETVPMVVPSGRTTP